MKTKQLVEGEKRGHRLGRTIVPVLGGAALALVLGWCGRAVAAGDAVITWNDETLALIRARVWPGPPMNARALFITHECIYDAWAAYDAVAVGTQLGGTLRRPAGERTEANKREALSYAAHACLVDLAASKKAEIDGVLSALGYDPANDSQDPATPAGVGHLAAQAVIAFRQGDGSNQLGDLHSPAYSDYTGYQPVNTVDFVFDLNRWQPLRFFLPDGTTATPGFLGPQWGLVTPFALESGSSLRGLLPGPKTTASPRAFRAQAFEIIKLTKNLNDTTKTIAEYWADGPRSETPPGHWNLFAQEISERDGHDLDADVKLFFAMNGALHDAAIMAWDSKRHWDSVRPITAIRTLYRGKRLYSWAGPYQGNRSILGEDWIPYQPASFITPPFAEYVSGHSSFSAAAAEVLRSFTGSDAFGASVTLPAGSSHTEPGVVPARPVTLSWPTFTAAADQAGISRRFGGIHFADGDLDARRVGRVVGSAAWEKALTYFDGAAS